MNEEYASDMDIAKRIDHALTVGLDRLGWDTPEEILEAAEKEIIELREKIQLISAAHRTFAGEK